MKAYTVASLAAEWDCSEGVIRKAINDGRLGCFRLGTLIRIPAEEVRRFECQNTASSGSGGGSPSSSPRVTESVIASVSRQRTEPAQRLKRAMSSKG